VRILAAFGGLFLGLMALAIIYRLPLAGWALRHALADAGATDVEAAVTALSPRHLRVQPLGFTIAGQRVQADKIAVDRPGVLDRSLGRVTIEGAAATLSLTALRVAAGPHTNAAGAAERMVPPVRVPFEQLQVDGHLALISRDGTRELAIDLQAKPATPSRIVVDARVAGPDMAAAAHGDFDIARQAGEFAVENARLELKSWHSLWAAVAPRVAAGWTIEGVVTADARGTFERGAAAGAAGLHLREGAVCNDASRTLVGGIAADLRVADVGGQPGFRIDANLAGPGLLVEGHGDFDPARNSGDVAMERAGHGGQNSKPGVWLQDEAGRWYRK